MTTLTIIPNYEKKRLKLVGTVAAGEHVAVTIVGGGEWAQSGTLRLRALFGGKTVAVFPYYTEQREVGGQTVEADAWGGDEDATCELNLNTIPAEKMLRFGGECLWVLDDPANHTLYGTGEFYVGKWPKHRPVDVPYDLDSYPDAIRELSSNVESLSTQLQLLSQNKVDKVSGKSLTTNDYTNEDKQKLDGIEAGAQKNVGVEFTQAEKTKLAGIADGANNYTLPPATASTLGGVKQGTGCEIASDGTLSVTGGGAADSVAWDDVTDKPNFATVATSGNYDDLSGKPTIPTVPTPITPSTDTAAQGKPADALVTGTLLDHLATEKQDKLSSVQLENIAAVPSKYEKPSGGIPATDLAQAVQAALSAIPGKAAAADLRYRIEEAGYATTGAKLPDGVTVRMNGEVVTYEIERLSLPLTDMAAWRMVIAGGMAFVWREDGTNGVDGMFDYKFYDANGDEIQGVPNLLVPRALADRTVNLITATDETSIDIELPEAVTVDGVRRARDFILDVDNSANASDLALEFTALGVDYGFVPLEDDSISEMMTIGGARRVRIYYTETPYHATGSLPVINVARVTLGDFVTSTTTMQGGN